MARISYQIKTFDRRNAILGEGQLNQLQQLTDLTPDKLRLIQKTWKKATHWDLSCNAVREEKESDIALIFIITSTMKIECGFELIALQIFWKNPGPNLDIKEKNYNFKVCLLGLQLSWTMFCSSSHSKSWMILNFFSTWWLHFQLIKLKPCIAFLCL